jgi:hypothetical protein
LPELFPDDSDDLPQVTIRRASLGPKEEEPWLRPDGEALLLTIPDVARYRVEGGSEIFVDVESGAPDRNVRLFLLGSVFGALLHQRGLLPLHANAIDVEGRAMAFMGESGAGKSTLASWFHDRGFPVIADDVCVVGFGSEGRPYAAPGLPRLRLWADALQLMGRDLNGLSRSFLDNDQDKFDVPIQSGSAALFDVPLAAIYLLDRGDSFDVAQLRGLEAAGAIFANTYRGGYLSIIGNHKDHWESAVRLVRGTPVFRVRREWDLGKLEDQYSRLVDHAEEMAARHGDPR